MGVYRAVRADNQKVVLVHEPEESDSHTIEIRNPEKSWTPRIEEGKRYIVSLSVTEYKPYVPLPAEEAPVSPDVTEKAEEVSETEGA